jgi:hypothetical protein
MRKSITLSALAVLAVSGEYLELPIIKDGSEDILYYRSQDWSETWADGKRVSVPNNNSILLKSNAYDGDTMAYKPRIRGGALEYTVDLSSVDCGCVAGVYLVALRHYGCNFEDEKGENAQCNSIDVMQANPYGFNVGVHPCAHGNCDAQR